MKTTCETMLKIAVLSALALTPLFSGCERDFTCGCLPVWQLLFGGCGCWVEPPLSPEGRFVGEKTDRLCDAMTNGVQSCIMVPLWESSVHTFRFLF